MKTNSLSFAAFISVLTIGCNNSADSLTDNDFNDEEMAKIELVKSMFLEHGWELD